MGDKTGIQWTDATWNPTVGCSIVSPGCTNCYAMRVAHRFCFTPGTKFSGLTQFTKAGPVWNGTVRLDEKALDQPLRWKRPRRIFVNSMSDLFHEALPDEAIDKVFAVMALAPQHTFQVLTKRAQRMRDYLTKLPARQDMLDCGPALDWSKFPLPNVWLGVSVERQQEADERIPLLLDTPAAVRFLSCEPLLGPIHLTHIRFRGKSGGMEDWDALDPHLEQHDGESPLGNVNTVGWVIVGGESGPGARPMAIEWAHSLVMQCRDAKVACFVKQLGADPRCLDGTPFPTERRMGGWDRKGGDMDLWPEDLRVREFPDVR